MSAEEAKQRKAETGTAPAGEAAIVAAIGTMSDLLASSLASLKSTMTESFGDMKASLDNLIVDDTQATEETEETGLPMRQPAASEQQKTVATAPQTVEKGQKSDSTEQSITKLISQSSEAQQEAAGEIDVLSGIANDLKLDHKKGPAVNQHLAKIVHGLMREKLSDEVLTETQNRYNRPENCECLTTTKVNHLIWDKLKPDTRSTDIKLQRVQSTLVKGVIPMVSIVEKLVAARDKVPKDALDVPGLIKAATDAIALIGAANFELNMRRRDNIKPELNEDYKHLCSSTVPFTESLFGDDSELSKQLKDLAEATKVSKKLSRSDSKHDAHKNHGFRSFKNAKSKGFGYKYRGQATNNKQLNWKRPSPTYNKQNQEGRRQSK